MSYIDELKASIEIECQDTPELLPLLFKLVDLINLPPSEEMVLDHILIKGEDYEQTKVVREIVIGTLRELRNCVPIKHEDFSEISEQIKDCIKQQPSRYEYLLLRNFQEFQSIKRTDLEEIMDIQFRPNSLSGIIEKGMRVVAIYHSTLKKLPSDIEKEFRLIVNVDKRVVITRDTERKIIAISNHKNVQKQSAPKKKRKTLLLEGLCRCIFLLKARKSSFNDTKKVSAPAAWDCIPVANDTLGYLNLKHGYQSSEKELYQTTSELQFINPESGAAIGKPISYMRFENVWGKMKKEIQEGDL